MLHRALIVALGVTVASLATASMAEDDPRVVREKLMEGIGDAAKVVGPMLQGKAPFDAAKAAEAFTVISKNAADFPNHFPEGTDTGKTEALPAIWQDKADFDARSKKLSDDATAAAAAAAQGEEAFKAAGGAAFGNCKGCHEKYRKPS